MSPSWSLLTDWLIDCQKSEVTISWDELGAIVGGLPDSATNHYPQWWSGDRPISRAWHRAGYEKLRIDPIRRTLTLKSSFERGRVLSVHPGFKRENIVTRNVLVPTEQKIIRDLESWDPKRTLIIFPCSGSKAFGGSKSNSGNALSWTDELMVGRSRMREKAKIDEHFLMPAWQRYTGGFYQAAGLSLVAAIKDQAHILILSGGYGVVRADEAIGTYEQQLKPADWKGGAIESALISESIRIGAQNIVAFVAASSGYAQFIRRTQWSRAGVEGACLVSAKVIGGGAMRKVPRDLGLAFAAFWNRASSSYPVSIQVEHLR